MRAKGYRKYKVSVNRYTESSIYRRILLKIMRLGAIPHQVSKDREKEDAQNWHTRTSGREEAITGDREGAAGEREAIESMGPGSLGRNCMDRRL